MTAAVNQPPIGRRAARTAATRRRMITAAYELFCEQGYDATTMNQIADRAQVAVQTLYFTFQGKKQLLHETFVHAVLGESAKPPHQQPWHGRMQRARTVRQGLAAAVDGAVDIFLRVTPLITAVRAFSTNPDVASVWHQQETMRRLGYTDILTTLSAKQPLRPGLTLQRATDTMLVILGPDVYRSQTIDNGWTPGEYRAWAANGLYQLLFQPT
ncbi:MAG: hypothetical protein NVS3B26_27260 [Mycobacteriales bacterium]